MKTFKILLKEEKQENKWGYQDKDEVKYGTQAKLDGEEYTLISLNSLVSIK